MSEKVARSFGLWSSPLSPRVMAAGKRLSEVQWDSDGKTLVWLEGRSDLGVLVASGEGGQAAPRDLTAELSVRAKVGYGGGDFVVAGGHVFFAAAADGRLYRQSLAGGGAKAVTPAFGAAASPRLSPDGKWLAYVHHDDDRIDRIGIVDAQGNEWPRVFATGHDFYTQPRWSPDGLLFAYVAWDHPEMPWDGATLYLAAVEYDADGRPSLGAETVVAGSRGIAAFQPEFAGDGKSLFYVADESGSWQIYQHDLTRGQSRQITATEETEYGLANWVQEMRTYALANDGRSIYTMANKRGFARIARVDLQTFEEAFVEELAPYTDVAQLAIATAGNRLAFVGSSPVVSSRVVVLDLTSHRSWVAARATTETLRAEDLSKPRAVQWPTAGGESAHGLYYPPASGEFTAEGKPPLVVIVHGGPTSQARAGWSAQAQFLATRGYAVLFVNHRGSTGYGRAYMLKLRGNWGVVDVEDSVSGARFLAQSGLADAERLVIMGGSAGGYTVLQTMVAEPDVFAAGLSLYGIANQFTLVQDTHKFEERYSDSLLGALPGAAAVYRDRSPLFHAQRIKRPLAVFQGEKDKVVPKDQAEQIVKALQRNGTPHVYHVYAGEGHGWRKTETIEHFYQAVDAFLREHVVYR